MKSILDKVLKVMNLPKGSLSKREEKIALEAYKLGRSSKQEKPDYKQSDIDKVVRYVKTRLRDLDILDIKVKKASFSDEWLNILITGFDRTGKFKCFAYSVYRITYAAVVQWQNSSLVQKRSRVRFPLAAFNKGELFFITK